MFRFLSEIFFESIDKTEQLDISYLLYYSDVRPEKRSNRKKKNNSDATMETAKFFLQIDYNEVLSSTYSRSYHENGES